MVIKQCLHRLNMADEATHADTTCNFVLDVADHTVYSWLHRIRSIAITTTEKIRTEVPVKNHIYALFL